MSTQRSILITGCSSGIGYHTALRLKEAGWRVFAAARSPQDVERLKNEGLEALQLDLADSDSIKMAVNWLQRQNDGRLDALLNNAAFAIPAAVEDLDVATLRHQFEGCLFGTHELTLAVLGIMRRQGYGRIIQNSSVLGLVSMPYRGAYAAYKHALEALSLALRMELHGSGIHVSLFECGPISSRFRENAKANFKNWINQDYSHHNQVYSGMMKRLESGKPEPFTLSSEAVAARIEQILTCKKPRAQYYITRATWLLTLLKRFLPYCWVEALLRRWQKAEAKRYQQ